MLQTRMLDRPSVLLHGGAGPKRKDRSGEPYARRLEFMKALALDSYRVLIGEHTVGVAVPEGLEPSEPVQPARYAGAAISGPRAAVVHANMMMELDERFNAGYGSKLQADGEVRTSAALAHGASNKLAAVYTVPKLLFASVVANQVFEEMDRNLDALGATAVMRELGMEAHDLRSPQRTEEWKAKRAGRSGTVGAVAVDEAGEIWALTATGGRGFERPGRISDTPTPAGNYACPAVAISATGLGEQIIDLNVCGRLATRMLDGHSLEAALTRTFDEIVAHNGSIGVIAVTPEGELGWAYTTEQMAVAAADSSGIPVAE